MVFKPIILKRVENNELKWLGNLWFKGLFDGEHCFRLIKNADGSTKFEHSENFKGILVPLFSKSLDKNTKNGFEAMNQKLKIIAENE